MMRFTSLEPMAFSLIKHMIQANFDGCRQMRRCAERYRSVHAAACGATHDSPNVWHVSRHPRRARMPWLAVETMRKHGFAHAAYVR